MTKTKNTAKAVAIVLTLCVFFLLLTSCDLQDALDKFGFGSNTDEDENIDTENNGPGEDEALVDEEGLIYNSKSELKVVLADYAYYDTLAAGFIYTIMDTLSDRVVVRFYDDANVFKHEIVIGESKREVSKRAYSELRGFMDYRDSAFGGCLLYSDGSSLALAYTDEIGNQHLSEVLGYLEECAKNSELIAKEGIIFSKAYNMHDVYAAADNKRQDEEFALLEKQTSKEVADAVRTLYDTLYKRNGSKDIITWLANLYEPRNCICENYVDGIRVCLHPVDENGKDLCKNGGFYYSKGARDTSGYLPDIESTNQALEFLEKSGMLQNYGNDFGKFISGQLRADIVAFTKGLQSPDGYFYHPQWTKSQYQGKQERLSRDLMWSVAILRAFGERSYYTTPTGDMTGTGGRPSAASALTSKLSKSEVISVSSVLPAASNLPSYLQSAAAFKSHLEGYGSVTYDTASQLASDINLIVSANRELGGDQIKKVLFEWTEKNHRADNGLWQSTSYDALNAAFKILMVYSAFREPFPYAEAALESTIAVLSSSERTGHVCEAYNAWYDVSGLIYNIRMYESSARADELQAKVIEIAPSAILNTITNTLRFLIDDGSFSYLPGRTAINSAGMNVSPYGKMGDVNASLICSGGLVEHMGQALGVKLPAIYGTRELAEFMDIIEQKMQK